MSRLPDLKYEDMSPEQQKLHDDILEGPRPRVAGPMFAWFLKPDYGALIQKVGAFCRYKTSFPPRLSELAIITVARHWNANVEWVTHSQIALEKGVSQEIIDTIENGSKPNFENDDDELIFDFTKSILETTRVPDEMYQRAREMWGEVGVLDLTAIIGYYSNVAIQINAFEIPADEGRTIKDIS